MIKRPTPEGLRELRLVLKALYDAVIPEGTPEHFHALLNELDARENIARTDRAEQARQRRPGPDQ